MGKQSLFKEAMNDVKDLQKLNVDNAKRVLAEALEPEIKKMFKESLRMEGEDELPPDEEDTAPEEEIEEMDAGEDEGYPEGDKTTIDLDKLAQEMETEMKREVEGELDLDVEEEEEEVPPVPKKEAKGEDEPPETDDEDLEEAYARLVSELQDPPKGEPDQTDPNTGKPTGLAASQKSKEGAAWNEEEPPDKKDWAVKEAWYQSKLAEAVKIIAEETKKTKILAKELKESMLDQKKLSYITRIFSAFPNADKSTKKRIVERMDEAKDIAQARILYNTVQSVLVKSKKSAMRESRSARPGNRSPSAPVGSRPQPKNQLNESIARMKKLANIKK